MTIRKDGFVCRVAYNHPLFGAKKPPEKTSLCKLFWRFLLLGFLGWPLTYTFYTVIMTAFLCIAFFFAHRPTLKGSVLFVPIKWMHGFWPFWPALVCWYVYSIRTVWTSGFRTKGMTEPLNIFLSEGTVVLTSCFLAIVIIGASCAGIAHLWKKGETVQVKPSEWEWVKISRAYLKARKQKICPIVEIK